MNVFVTIIICFAIYFFMVGVTYKVLWQLYYKEKHDELEKVDSWQSRRDRETIHEECCLLAFFWIFYTCFKIGVFAVDKTAECVLSFLKIWK